MCVVLIWSPFWIIEVAAGAGAGEVVDVLLLAGAPWNALDKLGRCAGEYAMMNDHSEVANQILDAGRWDVGLAPNGCREMF